MTRRRSLPLAAALVGLALGLGTVAPRGLTAAGALPTPEQFIGFPVGADRKLVRWDRILEYMQAAADASDRVQMRELGKTSGGQPFVLLEVSAAETLKNVDRYKQLERKLYFQGGAPTERERDEIFRQGKAVVIVTCSVHGNEIGATQMALELVHRLATEDSPLVRKILDNVILLLVPSANPDGQIAVTDWSNQNLGTPYENSPLPVLYHPYAGHDSNRDMYMLTQKESQYLAEVVWRDWLPSIWLDEHQMGSTGPRMFVMPAADPINPNVHPLIYRWNAILGQSQAAALEAAGKDGIIYNSTYTNFWQGALAWSGWWHNQIGLLTEVASARVAAPVEQLRASPDGNLSFGFNRAINPADGAPLPPPTDITPRTEYPRPWMGGRWTLRDIIDYELIATMALLETAADRREALLRQVYEVNRQTVEGAGSGGFAAIVVPVNRQHDPREAAHLVERLMMGGVEVYRAKEALDLDDRRYEAGAFVIPMTQVFARYAKDLLERQTYPEVRRAPNAPAEAPYDVTAWSLGMLLGVEVDFVKTAPPPGLLVHVSGSARTPGRVTGNGSRFAFEYKGPDTAIAINRLLKAGARVEFTGPSQVAVSNVERSVVEETARAAGLHVAAGPAARAADLSTLTVRPPRIALYAPWTGDSIDEGWTRWVLEQYEFPYTTVHNADMRRGGLRQRFDVLILPDQSPREIVDGINGNMIRPEYRGGIGDSGVESLARFVAEGGTLVALGASSDLAIDRLPVPVRNMKRGLRREQHYAPGTILHLHTDATHPLAYGVASETYGLYTNGPFFAPLEGFTTNKTTAIARFPASDVLASGWLRGEELMAGRAAVMAVDLQPGRVVLFGIRPQHRGQTHATFPLLFNALYLAAAETGTINTNQ